MMIPTLRVVLLFAAALLIPACNLTYTSGDPFATSPAPQNPFVLQIPVDGQTGVWPTNTQFAWGAFPGATGYELQISLDPNFNQILIDLPNLTVPSVFIQPDLTHSTTYYWRVYGSNGSGAIWLAGGSPFQFTTISPVFGTPAQFFLQAPLGVTVNRIPGPTFLWTYSTGAVAYRLQIDTSSSFPAPVVDLQNLHLNQATSPVTLAASTTFYWRVTAQNSWGQTVSTPLYGSFTTGP